MPWEIELKIWIDADACPKPVKEIIFKAAAKNNIHVCLVANSYMQVPFSPNFSFVQVEKGADMADFYIVKNLEPSDLIITQDIPLAALVVEKKATAIDVRGELFTEENVGERLSLRDFAQGLRNTGHVTKGPPPYGPKDKERFANSFNRILTQMLKANS